MKEITVLTHGDKYDGANPGLTPNGIEQIKALRPFLPKNPTAVIFGTARRHFDTGKAAGLEYTKVTSAVGDADSAEAVEGKKMIVLPDGTLVEPAKYTGLGDSASVAVKAVVNAPDSAIIVSGRPLGLMLKIAGQISIDFVSAAVYRITVDKDEIVDCIEVKAFGEFDKTLQG